MSGLPGKLHIGAEDARSAALYAAVAGNFCALALDEGMRSAAWVGAALGALPTLAVARWCHAMLRHRSPRVKRVVAVPLLVAQLCGAGAALAVLLDSAGFLALDPVQPALLLLPACLAALWCALRNGAAIGRAAALGMRLAPLLLIPILLLQLPRLRPGWLFPLLGGGVRDILSTALRMTSRALANLLPALLLPEELPDRPHPWHRTALWAGLLPAALMLPQRMMTPALTGVPAALRLSRLDSLLANGRAPLILQLPMIALWFTAMLRWLAWSSFSAAALLQCILPTLDGRLAAGMAVMAALIPTRFYGTAGRLLPFAVAAALMLLALGRPSRSAGASFR